MKISSLVTEYFYLDGGAMFGSVPKVLWDRLIPADERNRIRLACRVLLIEDGARRILVDLGSGSKWSEKQQRIYGFEPQLPGGLHERVTGVTDIILTHLHFDHCGGVSRFVEPGRPELCFPDAVHHVQEQHWLHAHRPGPREQATFFRENLEPLSRAKLNFVSPGEELLPGIRIFSSSGHTPHLSWLLIESGEGRIAFASELVPTAHHLPIPYVMGYDLCAQTTMAEKEALLERAVREDWVIVFDHDPTVAAGTVAKNAEGRYVLKDRAALPEPD